jgi:hypothetical protein
MLTIEEKQLTKNLSCFEKIQPHCKSSYIFVYFSSFIVCMVSKVIGFDQLWTTIQQKLATANRKLLFLKVSLTLFVSLSCKIIIFYRVFFKRGTLHFFSPTVKTPQNPNLGKKH